jgi:GTP-binding protein EngB required for normal cell division
MRVAGLTENHERSLLAGIQYAAKLIRDCEEVLAASDGAHVLSRYAGGLTPPQQKIAREYLRRVQQQLLHVLDAAGLTPPAPSIDAVRGLSTAMMFLDDTLEEMRGRYLRGYGEVSPEAERVLDGVVSETQELVREVEAFLTGVPDDVLRERLRRVPEDHPVAEELRELARIIADHGLVDLRSALAMLVDRALEDTFEVAVAGRVSSGKSSLLNALIGSPILPTGVLPVTAFPTRLRRGAAPVLRVTNATGRIEACAIDRVGEFVTEAHNPGNEKRLTRLLIDYPSDRLPDGVTFVDTPGLGSVASAGVLQTFAYLPRCDHATFLLDATAPVIEEDLGLLAFLRDAGITASVLLSKADLLSPADLAQVRAYTSAQIRARLRADVPVRPISALPSHESLLSAWIDEEIRPLGARAKAHGQEALVRKVGALRGQARGALERRRAPQQRPAGSTADATAAVTRIRDASARLERTSRELLSFRERAAAIVEATLAAGSAASVEVLKRQRTAHADDALRAALMRPAHALAEDVARNLGDAAREAQEALAEAAIALATPSSTLETLGIEREIPLLDLPPVNAEFSPPMWVRASPLLLRRWVTARVQEQWGRVVDRAVAAYVDVLKRWASNGLARLREEFESHSRPLLVQLMPPTASQVSSATTHAALERDLSWLRLARQQGTTDNAGERLSLSTVHRE